MYGRSWVRFPSGTQIFSLSHALDKLEIIQVHSTFASHMYNREGRERRDAGEKGEKLEKNAQYCFTE